MCILKHKSVYPKIENLHVIIKTVCVVCVIVGVYNFTNSQGLHAVFTFDETFDTLSENPLKSGPEFCGSIVKRILIIIIIII